VKTEVRDVEVNDLEREEGVGYNALMSRLLLDKERACGRLRTNFENLRIISNFYLSIKSIEIIAGSNLLSEKSVDLFSLTNQRQTW
jgi:hypothetical protein